MKLRINLSAFCFAIIGRKTAIKDIANNLSKLTRFKGVNIAPPPQELKKRSYAVIYNILKRFYYSFFLLYPLQFLRLNLSLASCHFQLVTFHLLLTHLTISNIKIINSKEKKLLKREVMSIDCVEDKKVKSMKVED